MKRLQDILNKHTQPFDVNNYGGLREDEYLLNDIIFCKNCNTARLYVAPDGNFRARCICKCQTQERDEAERREKARKRQAWIESLQEASLMGARYKNANFSTTETGHNATFDAAFIRCQKYCTVADTVLEKGLGIYMYGDKGTGKTHLTACMANELIQHGYQVLFTNFAEISKAIRSTFGKNNKSEADFINRFASVDFLFIDDLGTERVQSANGDDLWLQEKIFDVLNKRYNNKKPTIFTSNHSLPELINDRGFMGKTVDRITEMSNAIFKVEGESYRMKARAAVELPF